MVRIKVKRGTKGVLVIPKVIRESLGLTEDKLIILEVKDKALEIRAAEEEIPEKWRAVAEKEGFDVARNLVYGDKLYEQVFSGAVNLSAPYARALRTEEPTS